MSDHVLSLCVNNRNYFENDKSAAGVKIFESCSKLSNFLCKTVKIVEKIQSFAGEYDFDDKTPGNGYRSFIYTFDCAVSHTQTISKCISEKRNKFLFRKSAYAKEINVCSKMIESLHQVGQGLLDMSKIAEKGTLYARRCHHDNIITRAAKVINQECFFGRAIGFQYLESMRPSVKFIACLMASYSEFYYSNKNLLLKTFDLINMSRKYLLNPELCAQRICDINKNADIHFLISFLKMSESMPAALLVDIITAKVDVNKVFEIQPEPLTIFSTKFNRPVDVPIPESHIGKKPIPCRLLSSTRRIGMIDEDVDCTHVTLSEPSPHLIVHVHGGGWISQSSKTHEMYLREWAAKLDVPIFSIDYTLAHEAPFPRAIEEIFYAYCWALRNSDLVGSTGENVVFVGDSAGANLIAACIIKCIEMGVPKPKGVFNAYSIYLVNLVKTPARFMGFTDSFLPFGIVMKIFKLYGGGKSLGESSHSLDSSGTESDSRRYSSTEIPMLPDDELIFEIPKNYLLSPYWAPDEILKEFPPTKIVTMITDPCVDDCVDFGKKLRKLNVDVSVDILGPLFHGFLCFVKFSKECHEGSLVCMRRVAELLGLNPDEMD